jgi:hypothetical protein
MTNQALIKQPQITKAEITQPKPLVTPEYQNKFKENLREMFAGEILLLLGAVVGLILRNKWISYRKIKEIANDLLANDGYQESLRAKLAALLIVSEADRVLLVQFHNGSHFFNSDHQIKCSLTHQFLKENILPIPTFKDMMISQIYREVADLKNKKVVWINKATAFKSCTDYMTKINVTYYGASLVCSDLGMPLAIIGLHYCNTPPKINLEGSLTEELIIKIGDVVKSKLKK